MALRVGYCQFRPQFGAPTRNLETVEGLLGSVEADLVVLPELAFTGQPEHIADLVCFLASPRSQGPGVAAS